MTNMEGVSVIIPCYNGGKFLPQAIASVHNSAPFVPYEIIVVDDASTDPDTAAVLQSVAEDPKVRVFSMAKNSGQSAARNYAMEIAKFDIILPLDADDMIRKTSGPSFLDQAESFLSRNQDVLTVTTDYHQFGAIRGLCRLYPFSTDIHLVKGLIPPFSAFRRSQALEMGGYNTKLRFAEDWDFFTSLMNTRYKDGQPYLVAHLDKVHMLYRTHEGGQNASVKERMSRTLALTSLIERNPEIYDHYYPGKTADDLASAPTVLRTAFLMAAKHPIHFAEMAPPILRRRFHNFINRGPAPTAE